MSITRRELLTTVVRTAGSVTVLGVTFAGVHALFSVNVLQQYPNSGSYVPVILSPATWPMKQVPVRYQSRLSWLQLLINWTAPDLLKYL